MPMGEDPRHGLLVALVMALVGLLLIIFAALAVAPVLVIVLGLMTYVVWWYVSREDTSYMHHAQEHENRFWTTVAFCFSGALVFVHDSPVALGQWSPVLGFLFVMMFTFSVHSYDRQLHRSRIGRAPNFQPSVASCTMLHSNVQDKCRRISLCLSKLDNRLVATNLNHMLWADMVQNLEKEIVNILSDADPSELNYMLPKIGLGLLFYKVKDHAPINLHRTRLLNVLADTRISDLNVTSRALVLDALQQLRLSAHKDSEAYAKKIILKTKGDELSELKSLTDAKGDIHSIHKLVYRDIKDVSIREEVLKHIDNQAKVQAAHMRLGTRTGSRRSGKAWRKILSDVDDTLTSSGGRFPAGVDSRYPRKSVYPGVLDFYRELDLGVSGPSEWPKGQLGNLVFLSARPHVYKDMSESKSYAKFKKLQDEKGLYTSPTLLAGSIDTGTTMLITGNMEPVAEKKFQNFAEYVSLYPEFQHVFVGDNGQGDVRAAEMMAERFPGKLEAVYMHRVVPVEKTFGYQGAVTRERWRKANIVFVGDYVEAACHAYKNGLIQAVGLQRVCQGAVDQFVEMKFDGPLQRELQRRQINQSVWKANKLLQAADLEPNWLIRAERAFDDMEAVLTPFGRGTVVNFRPEDGVYEVLLDWSAPAASRVKPATTPAIPSRRNSALAVSQPHSLGQSTPRPNLLTRPSSFPVPAAGLARRGSTVPPVGALFPQAAVLASQTRPAPIAETVEGSVRTTGGAGEGAGGAATVGDAAPEVVAAAAAAAAARGDGSASNNPEMLLPPPPHLMPECGPDAAGGGEAVRGVRMRSNVALRTATATATATAAGSGATAGAATAAMAVMRGSGGAEEAAGGPAAAYGALGPVNDRAAVQEQAPSALLPLNIVAEAAAGAGILAGQEPREAAATALPEAAAEVGHRSDRTRQVAPSRSASNVDEQAAGSTCVPQPGLGRPPSEGPLVGCFGSADGSGAFWPHKSEDSPWEPTSTRHKSQAAAAAAAGQHDESVSAAAKVLAAKMPGSMIVRAYLQLPSLKKAPPEKITKDEVDEPKSGRLPSRLSIFIRQQDSGSAASSRSSAKAALVKGAVVQTFLGPATVRRVRTDDGMCEVAFHKWILGDGRPVFGVLRVADLVAEAAANVGKSPSLFGRTGKAISSLFKLNAGPPSAPPEPRVGDIVHTIFGPAAVTAIRGGPPAADSRTTDKSAATAAAGEAKATLSGGGGGRGRGAGRSGKGVSSLGTGRSGFGAAGGVYEGGPAAQAHKRSATAPSASQRLPISPSRPARHHHQADHHHQKKQQLWTPPRLRRPTLLSTPPPASSSVTATATAGANSPAAPGSPLFNSLPPPSPLRPTPPSSATRPRGASISVPGRDDQHHSSFSSGDAMCMGLEGLGELERRLSGSAAGELFPGQLLSSPPSVLDSPGQRGVRQVSAERLFPSMQMEGFDAPTPRVDSDGESDEEGDATSPLGIRILERRGDLVGAKRASAASPTDAVMYEVAFMKWRLANNTPARAVLNRASIWAEWEKRPSSKSVASTSRLRSSRSLRGGQQRLSRPSSFFGFMLGGYAGGGTPKILGTPTGSPQRSGTAKIPAPLKAAPATLHLCEFPPGACVKTRLFGPALVTKFRPKDGIYEVSLLSWRLRSGGLATAFLNRTALVSRIAVPEAAVRTSMGLGRVKFVREDGVVVVVAREAGSSTGTSAAGPSSSCDGGRALNGGDTLMFLQLSAILGPAKATLGERVDTPLGWGLLRAYRPESDTYLVDLGWGLIHSPHGSAIREPRPLTETAPLSARSSGGIIKLFRWPLFGSGPSASAAPFPPVEV